MNVTSATAAAYSAKLPVWLCLAVIIYFREEKIRRETGRLRGNKGGMMGNDWAQERKIKNIHP